MRSHARPHLRKVTRHVRENDPEESPVGALREYAVESTGGY